jgi:hypothetical protein
VNSALAFVVGRDCRDFCCDAVRAVVDGAASSVMAGALRWLSPSGGCDDDQAQRERHQPHEFEYQRVHGNIPLKKPAQFVGGALTVA